MRLEHLERVFVQDRDGLADLSFRFLQDLPAVLPAGQSEDQETAAESPA